MIYTLRQPPNAVDTEVWMRPNRFFATIAAGLGVIALVPVATALGDDSPGATGQTTEAVTALGTAFTYQGRLTDGGSPANGAYDIRFILFDAESGGAQVGTTVAKEEITVTNGLFSTELDFGAASFTGDARWVELAVRPGSGTGTGGYTVLSPRQPVSPAPYALFAKTAAAIAVPFVGSGSTAGAPATPEGIVTISQAGTGIAIAGNRTSTDAVAEYPAVLGTNSGLGAGVQGESTNANGVGVRGFAIGASGTGGYFSGTTALELAGALKVSGSNPAAFIHTVDTSGADRNTCPGDGGVHAADASTYLTVTDQNAMVIITPVNYATGAALSWYPAVAPSWCPGITNRWVIFSTDGSSIPNGTRFNVLVINQ